jgi:ribose/xylose/arabinose/galactoside ABC-type transport system permease subunit
VSDTTASNGASLYTVPHHPVREFLTGSVASIGITFILVLAVGLVWAGPKFLSFGNISIIGTFLIVPLIVGAFAGFALLSGVVDLSIGSMVGFSSASFALLLSLGWDPWSAAAVTLALCLVFGGINAAAIVGFGAEPIAATLGMLVALRGITWVLLGSQGAIFAFNIDLFNLVSTSVFGLPLFFLLAIALTLLATVMVAKTRLGRHVRAVGGDDKAAARAGISLSGGRGNFWMLLLSVGFLSTIPTSLVFFGLSSDTQSIFQGLILVIAVSIDGYRALRRTP